MTATPLQFAFGVMIPWRRFLIAIASLSIVVIVALAGCGEPPRHPAMGVNLPPLPIAPIADLSATPLPLAGRVTLLNYWGTWCGPCRRELPGLARMATSLAADRRFQLVAVSVSGSGEESPADLAAETGEFLLRQKLPISAYVFTDPLNADLLSTKLRLQAVPATYLVGPDATVRRVWVGYRPQDESDMAAAIVALLKETAIRPE